MAIRRNFMEEVTEEAPTKVVNDPDANDYDKTDCYSQDVPVGDEKIAGTVDADLGDKEEKLEDDGIPTLEQAMLEEMIYEEMYQAIQEAKIKSKEDLENQLTKLQGQPGAATKALGWFKAIVGGAATVVGSAKASGAISGAVAKSAMAAGGSSLGVGLAASMVPAVLIVWAMRKVLPFMLRQPGSINVKTKEAKKVLAEVDKAIRKAVGNKVYAKTEEDKKKIEKWIEQLKAGRDKAQKELDELIEAGNGNPENPNPMYMMVSKKTGKAYSDMVSKANINRQTKKDEKKAAKEAKKAAKNESTVDNEFDAFIEAVLGPEVTVVTEGRKNDNKIKDAVNRKYDLDGAIKRHDTAELKKLRKIYKKALAGIQKAKTQKVTTGGYWELPQWLLFLLVPMAIGIPAAFITGNNKTKFTKDELAKFESRIKSYLAKCEKALAEGDKGDVEESAVSESCEDVLRYYMETYMVNSMNAVSEGECSDDKCGEDEHCEMDKTVDVAGEGDGVDVTDTISGVIDDEKKDNEISTRRMSPNVDGVSSVKTVCVNNEMYSVRVTARKINDTPPPVLSEEASLNEGMLKDAQIKNVDSYIDRYTYRDIIKIRDAIYSVEDAIDAAKQLRSSSKTNYGRTFSLNPNSTKYSKEELDKRISDLNAVLSKLNAKYKELGGDQIYYQALNAQFSQQIAFSQSIMAVNSY